METIVKLINGYGFYPASYKGVSKPDFIKKMKVPTGFDEEQLGEAYKILTGKEDKEADKVADKVADKN